MDTTEGLAAPNRTTRRMIVGLCKPFLQAAVSKLGADEDVKEYHTTGFCIGWMSMAMMSVPSIQDFREQLELNDALFELVGWPKIISKSHSGRLQHCRPVEVWGDLLGALLDRAHLEPQDCALRLVDTSFVGSSLKLLSRRYSGKAMDKATAGIKVGVVLDPEAGTPETLVFRVGQDSDSGWVDILMGDEQEIEGTTYAFDRGFRKYAFYDRIIDSGGDFVTRATALIAYRDPQPRQLDPEHPDILSDDVVLLGSDNARNRMQHPVRRIEVRNTSTRKTSKDKKNVVLLASDLDSPAHELAELYRRRWEIEIFFRWLKCTIGAADVPGYSMEAAIHWLCACLVSYLIILICHRAAVQKPGKQALPGLSKAAKRTRIALDRRPPPEFAEPLEQLLDAMLLLAQAPPHQQPGAMRVVCQGPDQLAASKKAAGRKA